MTGRPSVELAMACAAEAREAAFWGRYRQAADLYKRALLILYNLERYPQGHEAESPAETETPSQLGPVTEAGLAPEQSVAANTVSKRGQTG